MNLEEGRLAAHARGVEMRPASGEVVDGLFIEADVFDLIYAVLEETHPDGKAPSARHEAEARREWDQGKERVRALVFESFDDGLRGKAFKEAPKIAVEV